MKKSLVAVVVVTWCWVLALPAVGSARTQTYLASISGSYSYSAESSYTGDESLGCTITDRREVEYESEFWSKLPVTITVSDEEPPVEGGIRIDGADFPIKGTQKRTTRDSYHHQGPDCSGTYPAEPVKCNRTGKGTVWLDPDSYPVTQPGEHSTLVNSPDVDAITATGIYSGGTDCFGQLFFADNYVPRYFFPSTGGFQNRDALLKPNRKQRRNGLVLKGSQNFLEGGVAGPDDDGTWSSGWNTFWKLKLTYVD